MFDLTLERARELLDYDPDTGVFRWRVRPWKRSRAKAGDVAGHQRRDGYTRVGVDGVSHYGHRLALFISTGEWPSEEVDHIDRNPANNRLSNLRAVSKTVNAQNIPGPRYNNKSGYLGARYHKQSGLWHSRIRVEGRTKSLGYFDAPEIAAAAYLAAKRQLHPGNTL